MHRNEFDLSEISASVSARPSQVADRRKSLGVLSDLSPIILPCESKNQHYDQKGVSSRKDFGGMMLFCLQEEEKTMKEVLG